ncbi:MAG TPA: cysteine desulfurase [Bdellovibrionota bacterium]|nr:cysteine desulfurase [Bdellovibrionota bacterium]
MSFDVAKVRSDFPILGIRVHGKPLVYLDNAATTQKPRAVIDAISNYYLTENANIHRGVHALSEIATRHYEGAREKVRAFLGARQTEEIVFVRGTTEAINLVAQTYGRANVRKGDEIVISAMEHHSNIVPWQMLCEQTGAVLKIAPITKTGELRMDELDSLITSRTKIVAVNHISNALGTINPVARIAELAHARGAIILVDGAQAAPHLKIDVRSLGCDFYAVSGHKLYGPTGVGALYGRKELLEKMPPWQGGGDMIRSVSFEKTSYNVLPYKFEAGTPDISGVIGLGAAIDYVSALGLEEIAAYEDHLLTYATEKLSKVPGVRLIGTAREKASVLSFEVEGIHPHDVGTILDQEGIAIRTGHHCAQPLMDFFGVPATVRASFSFYNTTDEADHLAAGIKRVQEVFK